MRTVHRWIEAGDMPAVRLPGGHLRIAEAALTAQLAAWATPPPTDVGSPDADG